MVNNRGLIQGIAFFIMLIVGLIIIAPIILKVGTTILSTTSTQLSAIDQTNVSSDNVDYVKGMMTNSFDWIIMFFLILNVLVLLITAFLIDVHPAFVIIYILAVFVMVITLPYTLVVAEKIYGMNEFSVGEDNVVQYLPLTQFMLDNFGVIIVGIIVLSGIIMYAKIKFGSQSTGGTTY